MRSITNEYKTDLHNAQIIEIIAYKTLTLLHANGCGHYKSIRETLGDAQAGEKAVKSVTTFAHL